MVGRIAVDQVGGLASMGPGCFHPRNIRPGFEGARMPMLQWGRDVSIPEMSTTAGTTSLTTWLQWGRDVSIPEIGRRTLPQRVVARLQWGRDVSIPEMRAGRPRNRTVRSASMGPGCFHPRNDEARRGKLVLGWLQWGRDVSIPEMPAPSSGCPRYAKLQWGRDVSIPEISSPGLMSAR